MTQGKKSMEVVAARIPSAVKSQVVDEAKAHGITLNMLLNEKIASVAPKSPQIRNFLRIAIQSFKARYGEDISPERVEQLVIVDWLARTYAYMAVHGKPYVEVAPFVRNQEGKLVEGDELFHFLMRKHTEAMAQKAQGAGDPTLPLFEDAVEA